MTCFPPVTQLCAFSFCPIPKYLHLNYAMKMHSLQLKGHLQGCSSHQKCEYIFFFKLLLLLVDWQVCASVDVSVCIWNWLYNFSWGKLQVHRYMVIKSSYSDFSRSKFGSYKWAGGMAAPFLMHLGSERRGQGLRMAEFSLVKWHKCLGWHTWYGMPHGHENWHTNDVDCDGILSCDCSYDKDSSWRVMRLSIKDKQSQISM